MRLENLRKIWNKKTKEKIWTIYYEYRMIFTDNGMTSHGGFFERLKSNFVFFETFDGDKRIELHKGGNIIPKVMKKL
jgi:hypothetical protein